jgi:hypothetical protein
MFKTNELINEIKIPENLYNERKTKFDPSLKMIEKSLDIIKTQWNRDQKSRSFIKHLISEFIPINYFNRLQTTFSKINPETNVIEKDVYKCAILGIKLTSMQDLMNKFTALEPLTDKINDLREKNEPFDKEFEELSKKINKFPIEIREYSLAYYALKSTKYLSIHALIALSHFTEQALLLNDKEVLFTVTKVRLSNNEKVKNSKITKTEINALAKMSSYGLKGHHISDKSYNVLEKLKLELNKQAE